MESFLTDFVNQIINNFNFAYMLSINILTYMLIKTLDYFNKDKQVNLFIKRLIDIIAYFLGLILLSPIFLAIAIAIFASVTVSIAAVTKGIFNSMLRENLVVSDTLTGITSE